MKQAIATKYKLYLSRRRYTFLCKIQDKTFCSTQQQWNKNCINYGDQKLNLRSKSISETAIKLFVNNLDIGEIHTVPGYCGAFLTVTALTNMMIDLHLRCDSLRDKPFHH